MDKTKVTYMDVDSLIPYANNPRLNDNAVDAVAASIKEFGFKVPIVVDGENVIINGHTRLKAAHKLGLKQVPVIVADDLTPEQVKAFRLADNKTSELAEWDMDKLDIELDGIDEIDMGEFGFCDVDFGDFGSDGDLYESDEDEDVPEPPDEPVTKLGDVYRLGNHILMCGDSTKPDDVHKLMQAGGGGSAALLITDPPYNVDYTGKSAKAMKIENDSMDASVFHDFLLAAFGNAYDAMADGAAFYVWYASRGVVDFATAIEEAGLTAKQELIWNKSSFVAGWKDYQWKHESCLYGWKETGTHNWYGDRKQTTVIDWDRPTKADLHPTMKPVGLFDYQIRNSSAKNDIVLDLFGGSGTTIIACEQNGRMARVMEYDPKYADVIVDRWEKLTGMKAVKVEDC